ncbi:hypothetical protein OY671_008919, partial [Metschnikowia pulcherrima]
MTQSRTIARRRFAESRAARVSLLASFSVPRASRIRSAVEPTSDAAWYYSRADMSAHGLGYLGDHGEPTAYWPGGWPSTSASAFRAFGTSIWTVGSFNRACAG